MSTKLQEESSDDDKMVARKGKRGLSLESEHNSDDVPVSAPAASTPKETKKKQGKKVKKDRKTYTEMDPSTKTLLDRMMVAEEASEKAEVTSPTTSTTRFSLLVSPSDKPGHAGKLSKAGSGSGDPASGKGKQPLICSMPHFPSTSDIATSSAKADAEKQLTSENERLLQELCSVCEERDAMQGVLEEVKKTLEEASTQAQGADLTAVLDIYSSAFGAIWNGVAAAADAAEEGKAEEEDAGV